MIASAQVGPGHDGEAVLVVQVRYPNGARDAVTLDARRAQRLLEACGAERAEDLGGQPWQRLLAVIDG